MKTVSITTPYITLGQLLKYLNLASGGGEIKARLETGQFLVENDVETRRGRKLYPGMRVTLDDGTTLQLTDAAHHTDA